MLKIRVKVKGYDQKVVESTVKKIVSAALETGATIKGPIPLPNKMWKIAVHRSPHIDAKSKEHFGVIEHFRLLDILDPNPKTVEALTHIQLPSGVGISIKS